MVDSGIILKIQKLLALASSSNENEAQAAMMKAQEMLAKYKLSMKDVQSKHPESKAVKKAHGRYLYKGSMERAPCIRHRR